MRGEEEGEAKEIRLEEKQKKKKKEALKAHEKPDSDVVVEEENL